MPYIPVPNNLPGITGLLAARPDTAEPLNLLAHRLLVSDVGITRGERELIAAYVSKLNQCNFCYSSHRAFAEELLGEHKRLTETLDLNPLENTTLSPKMQALLHIAGKVQKNAQTVSPEDIVRAREAGCDDHVIHDTVLIAAAFCMFNRYVDGLGTDSEPTGSPAYVFSAKRIAEHGYLQSASKQS